MESLIDGKDTFGKNINWENSADLKEIVSLGLDIFILGLSWSWKPALSEQKHLKQLHFDDTF